MNCRKWLLALAMIALSGCATKYTVDDGSPVDENLLSAIRLYGKAEQVMRPQIIKTAQLRDEQCDKQYELPFVVTTSYDLPKMERIAWVRGMQVDERLTIVAATEESGLRPNDKIAEIDGDTDDADDLLEELMKLRDDGDEFDITLSDGRKLRIKPVEVCRGHVEVTRPSAPKDQDYHWIKSTHAMSIFNHDITPDEALWMALWTQGLSEEAGARMKTYHYCMKLAKTTLTLASIASGVGAAANAASTAAAQYAASEAGKQAAQAAGKELAKFAAEQVADAARKKMIETAAKEIAKATAQEVAVTALRTAAIFKANLSGVSWIAGSGFYMADKWAFDRMVKMGADPLAAYTLHYKLASNLEADNAFVFDEERLEAMTKFAEATGMGEKVKLALNGKDPYVIEAVAEAVVMPGTIEMRSLDDPAPTAAAQAAPTTLADATTMTSPRQVGTAEATTTEPATESKAPVGDSVR